MHPPQRYCAVLRDLNPEIKGFIRELSSDLTREGHRKPPITRFSLTVKRKRSLTLDLPLTFAAPPPSPSLLALINWGAGGWGGCGGGDRLCRVSYHLTSGTQHPLPSSL